MNDEERKFSLEVQAVIGAVNVKAGAKEVGDAVQQVQKQITQNAKSEAKAREKIALAETKLRTEQEKTVQARIKESSKQILAQMQSDIEARRIEYHKDTQAQKTAATQALESIKAADRERLENLKNVNRIILENHKNVNRMILSDHKAQTRERQKNEKDFANAAVRNANEISNAYSVAASRMLMAFRQTFNEALRYVQDFDKQLTSIAIVTGDSSQKSRLGERYENMAQEMKVSAIEIAEAAEQLYRQGLGSEKEVENRLRVITEYAKISGLTFSEAVEAMTATINSFTKDGESGADTARHIADVWAYMGDSVATSSAEIGIAMQKVASSGQAAGIGLEKLSSYIAVIEAYTRAAPESVGTALNSMMSRYMKVTSRGFGASVTTDEGDVVSINDIAAALNKVDISVYTAGEGFKEFGDVLDEVASKWEKLDDNERNYIATQIAGTRGMNYFLSLMNGYSQVVELTAGAYDSAGVSVQKFSIWQEGLEASMAELDAAIKDLYSDLLPSETVNGVVRFLTSLVQLFSKATEATGGLNVKLALVAAGLLMVFRAIQSIRGAGGISGIITSIGSSFFGLQTAATGATVALTGVKAVLASFGVGLVIAAITTIVGALISLSDAGDNAKQKLADLREGYAERDSGITTVKAQLDKLKESFDNGTLSVEEYLEARAAIVSEFPELDAVLGREKDAVDDLAGAYENLVGWAEKKAMAGFSESYVSANQGLSAAIGSYDSAGKSSLSYFDKLRAKYFKGKIQDLIKYGPSVTNGYSLEALEKIRYYLQEGMGSLDQYSSEYEQYANALALVENQIVVESANVEKQRQEALETIIRAAIDPTQFGGNYMYATDVIQQFLAIDWGDASADQIYATAKDFMMEYASAISRASTDEEVQQILENIGLNFYEFIGYGMDEIKKPFDEIGDAQHIFLQALGKGNVYPGMSFLDKWHKQGQITTAKQISALGAFLRKYNGEEQLGIINLLDSMFEQGQVDWESGEEGAPKYNSVWDMIYASLGVELDNGSVVVGEPVQITGGTGEIKKAAEQVVTEIRETLHDLGIMPELMEELTALEGHQEFTTARGQVIPAQSIYKWLTSALSDDAWLGLIEELEWMDLDQAHALVEKLMRDYLDAYISDKDKEGMDLGQFYQDLSDEVGVEFKQPGQTTPRSVEQYKEAVAKFEEMTRLSGLVDTLTGDLDNADFTDLKTKDLDKLLEAYPQLVAYMGDMNEMRAQAIALLASENDEYGWLLEKYGLALDKEEDLTGAVLANITANNKAYAAIRKIQGGYKLTESELTALTKEYPEVTDELYKYIQNTDDAAAKTEAINALWRAQTDANAKAFVKNLQSIVTSMADVDEGTADYRQALDELGNLFTGGIGDMSSYDFAAQYIDQIREAAEGSEEALRKLQEAAFIHIVGTASADFTPIRDGLYDVSNLSQETLQVLQSLGLFDIETVDLPMTYYDLEVADNFIGGGARFDDGMGSSYGGTVKYTPVKHTLNAGATVLKFKNSNISKPKTKSSGGSGGSGKKGGGGGGGGSSKSKTSSEVQNQIDALSNLSKPLDYRLKIAEAWEEYYQQTGELTKTIPYMEEQIKIHQELSEVYAKNRKELEPLAFSQKEQVENIQAQIESLRKLRDQYSSGSSAYKNYDKQIATLEEQLEAMLPDYEALVEAVDGYALSEINAKKAIDELNQKIKEQRTAIRTLRADMKNTINEYIDNLKEQQRELVEATISMQDTIIDILREEAQKELDIEKDKLEAKKDLLSDELTALRDNYNDARDLAEKQAKEDELREKQRQLSILATDPTKAKQRASLEKEIAKLREEMAWDAAEAEVSANEDAVQQEIDNLDELIDANRKAYDEISGYNEQLVEQMYQVMAQTEDEMIAWLKEHSTAYAESTEEARGQMAEGWEETLDTIFGVIKTNWPEVEDLMVSGLDRIIAKLKETTSYMTSNTEEQENMVESLTDSWNDMLDSMKLLGDTEKENNQKSIYDQNGNGGNANGADTGTTSTGAGESIKTKTSGRYYLRDGYSTTANAITVIPDGATVTVDGYHDKWYKVTYGSKSGWISSGAIRGIDRSKLKQYAKGGLVNFTGPAWLDGTPGSPEGILSADQMKLFSRFVLSLERLAMPSFGDSGEMGMLGGMTVEPGGIVINVESLAGESDYQKVAQGVMNAIYDQFKVRR